MSRNSEEDVIKILKQLQAEVVSIGQQVGDKISRVVDSCLALPQKLKEANIEGKIEVILLALLDQSPVQNLRATNHWLVNSYIWAGIGSTLNYTGQDVGRFIAPLFFGWWVSNMWAGILAFVVLPVAYLTLECCPMAAESVGSDRWKPSQHRLALLIITFLMGVACGFSLRHLPNSPFIASVPIPILVGIAAHFIGQRIDQWARQHERGMERIHVIGIVLAAALLPNTILNLIIYRVSFGFWVSLILTAVLIVVRFQLMISATQNASSYGTCRSKSTENGWQDRVLPIIMTDLSLLFDFIVRYNFATYDEHVDA